MDIMIKSIPEFGEIGIDTEASPGNGQYYVKLYDGWFDSAGYDSENEAYTELLNVIDLRKSFAPYAPILRQPCML